jgi:hypothetical protein
MHLDAKVIATTLGGYRCSSGFIARCPAHDDRTPSLSISERDGRLLVRCHAGCEQDDVVEALRSLGLWRGARAREHFSQPIAPPRGEASREPEEQLRKARWLWKKTVPLPHSPGERYLRTARGYGGPLPATLRFLPAQEPHPPAIVAAFGLAAEPGLLAIAEDAIRGVHLTRLQDDGSGKAESAGDKPKIMVGPSSGFPIVLAPPNDMLGLAVTEGIEDALSIHEATGLGAWAAGAAGRLPKLAARIPAWIDCVTIAAHADPPGEKGALELAEALARRGIETLVEGLP